MLKLKKPLLADELRRDVDPGGLAAKVTSIGRSSRLSLRRSTPSLDPPAAPGLGTVERDPEVGSRLRRRVSPSHEVVGDVCKEQRVPYATRKRPGRPSRPPRSIGRSSRG